MSINKEYAKQFKEMGYKRKVIAYKFFDEMPEGAEDYGDGMSFMCAISAESWEEGRKPFYITSKNSLCGDGEQGTSYFFIFQLCGYGGSHSGKQGDILWRRHR